ncbi:MAG: OmpA family protein [Azoarcus sp.]|jgi:outer membrane protein OmpA-like peptidoglycan-associated protein|nr:OmpA family protein [Azoarcus sp.]
MMPLRASVLYRVVLLCCAGVLIAACQTPPPAKRLSAEQIQILREIGFHREEDGWGFDLDGRLLFDSNASTLSAPNRETIARLVKVVTEIGIEHLRIEGHADGSGRKRINNKLSRRRAEAVAREIARNGIPYENITVRSFGATSPVGDNTTREGRALNRRVVIIVPSE